MAQRDTGRDNDLLVEFQFLINMDMAMYFFMRNTFANNPTVFDIEFMNLGDYDEIARAFLYRPDHNPLSIMMPGLNTEDIYKSLMGDNEKNVLNYAVPYSTYFLMNTFKSNASSLSITILCKNEVERSFLKDRLHYPHMCIVVEDYSKLDLTNYSALMIKYFTDALQFDYNQLTGKHIYIHAAKYNFDKDRNTICGPMSILLGDVNKIKLIDPYDHIKYRFETTEEEEQEFAEGDDFLDDSFEYSSSGSGETGTEGYAWYNF